MTFRLIDCAWNSEFSDALNRYPDALRIICPFIKNHPLAQLLAAQPHRLQVITRFNLSDFAQGVSDIDALRQILNNGGTVRGIKGLHAKLYIFGSCRAIITSANLTTAALSANTEFGILTEDSTAMEHCLAYFHNLWSRAQRDLEPADLDQWESELDRYHAASGTPQFPSSLQDFGAKAGFEQPYGTPPPALFSDPPEAFVKFLGNSKDRVALDHLTIEQVRWDTCHYALTYRRNRRPRSVPQGAVMFISRFVKGPDIRVFGRAIAYRHQPGRDEASSTEIQERRWKNDYPHYIRVHHPQFVAGTLANGVSLYQLMDTLKSDIFATTQNNAARQKGNTNPRRAYGQKTQVKLSKKGFSCLSTRLQEAFDVHGTVPKHDLRQLDWPALPVTAAQTP